MALIKVPYVSNDNKMIDTVEGVSLFPHGPIYQQYLSSAAVANTVTETTILDPTLSKVVTYRNPTTGGVGDGFYAEGSSLTIPANSLKPGTRFQGVIKGTIANTGTPTLRTRAGFVKGGSTFVPLADTTAIAMTTTGTTDFEVQFDLVVRTIGTAGSVVGSIYHKYGATIVTGTTALVSSVDTTVDNVIDCRITWGAASASNTETTFTAIVQAY